MIVVSDSTPLISLMKADCLHILNELYSEILIPEGVYSESTSNNKYYEESEIIKTSSFIRVVTVDEPKAVDVLQRISGLDRGESEAIIFADDNKADILLVDEAAGRKVARSMGLHIQGTIGVLLEAYDNRILNKTKIEKAIALLKENHRHISYELYEYALNYIEKENQ